MAITIGLHVFVSVTALHADLTWSFAIRGFVHQNNVESVATVPRCVYVCGWVGGGGEGYFGSQVTGMIEWGQKAKPKKIPRASKKPPKNRWTKK